MVDEEHQPRRRGRPPKPLDADGSSAARLGFEVRRRREQRGLTQDALAVLMGFSPQHVSAVELGQTAVSEQFIQACDDALQADGQLVELLPLVLYERAQARWSNRAARRSDRQHPASIAASTDAEVIGEMISALRRVDNRFGGGYARGVVLGYLKEEVKPVLSTGQKQCTAPRRLLQVVAELTQLAGWIAHDIGDDRLARWCFDESLRLAREAEDKAFESEVLAGMSQQAAYLGDGRTAVDAAQEARRHAIRSDAPAFGPREVVATSLIFDIGSSRTPPSPRFETSVSRFIRWTPFRRPTRQGRAEDRRASRPRPPHRAQFVLELMQARSTPPSGSRWCRVVAPCGRRRER
jgi:transcriptional regulator with XRE-family HTH domain